MGTTSSTEVQNTKLRPQPQGVAATYTAMCAHEPMTLHVKELSFDDFTIRNATTGDVLFRIDASMFSISDKKRLYDTANQLLLVMRSQCLSWRPKFDLYRSEKATSPFMTVKAGSSTIHGGITAKFVNLCTKEICHIVLDGDWRAKNAIIWLIRGESIAGARREPIAKIYRPSMTSRNLVLGHQDYFVDIVAGVDILLMAMLCVIMDEDKNESSGCVWEW